MVASRVPELPAPAMPMARPWCCGGYHPLASGRAAAKLAPATPSSRPSARNCPYDAANCQPMAKGMRLTPSPMSPVRRPPKRSVIQPRIGRKNDPPRRGTAVSTPFWVAVSLRLSARKGASGPSRTQTMKLTSK